MDGTRDFHCIVGPPESGKSTLAERLYAATDRGVAAAYDPADRYGGVLCDDPDELAAHMWSSEIFRAVYIPEPDEFDGLCEMVLARQRESRAAGNLRPITLLVDELALYKAAYDARGKFAECCRQGRHLLINGVVITQQPKELPLFARNAMTHYYFFQTVEGNALEFVREMFGRERAEQVKTLPPFVPLIYDRRAKTLTPPLR